MTANSSIDLSEVAKLVAALEHDLLQVQQGSQDLQSLRDEVAALQRILNDTTQNEHEVSHGLQQIRTGLENVKDVILDDVIKAAQYIAEIGRLIGL